MRADAHGLDRMHIRVPTQQEKDRNRFKNLFGNIADAIKRNLYTAERAYVDSNKQTVRIIDECTGRVLEVSITIRELS